MGSLRYGKGFKNLKKSSYLECVVWGWCDCCGLVVRGGWCVRPFLGLFCACGGECGCGGWFVDGGWNRPVFGIRRPDIEEFYACCVVFGFEFVEFFECCFVFGEEFFVGVAEACVFAFGVGCSRFGFVCVVGAGGVFGGEDASDVVDELLCCLFDWGVGFGACVVGCEGEGVEVHVRPPRRGVSCGACSDTRMHL